MAILAILASLFGCGKNTPFEPQILDGPGMEYVDSEYRNDYANCLPFDDIRVMCGKQKIVLHGDLTTSCGI